MYTTPIPNDIIDRHLADLTGGELKVLLYIVRRTFGFHKASDTISYKQIAEGIRTRDGRVLDRGTGLSRRQAMRCAQALRDKGIIWIAPVQNDAGDQDANRMGVVTSATLPSDMEYTTVVTSTSREVVTTTSSTINRSTINREQEEVWSQAKEALKYQLTPDVYTQFLSEAKLLSLEDGVATIEAPNERAAEFMEVRLQHLLIGFLKVQALKVIKK